ncbi:hypothetical protein Echvi_3570 [Echinicola vietnamensis DSM 17526]|uniref:Uncharacterized protein n=1 Tax=Echinicola vietnamensis (strain DSM 17526 / LMG 23754 / KMM 6221) TaxID=926556 RepID=L0G444_ECHVK|nr:hypothetical protein Echvi_3570 [Echinicola vietnamensis DSM 17526]
MGFTHGYECAAPFEANFRVTTYTIPRICNALSILSEFIRVHAWPNSNQRWRRTYLPIEIGVPHLFCLIREMRLKQKCWMGKFTMGFTHDYECAAPFEANFRVTTYTIPRICNALSILSEFIRVHAWPNSNQRWRRTYLPIEIGVPHLFCLIREMRLKQKCWMGKFTIGFTHDYGCAATLGQAFECISYIMLAPKHLIFNTYFTINVGTIHQLKAPILDNLTLN